MKITNISKTALIFLLFQSILSNYPEDYSTIDQLTNPENKDNEIFLGSYYHSEVTSSPSPSYLDYRNGIIIKPAGFSDSNSIVCTYLGGTYSGDDDKNLDYSLNNNIFYPPSLHLTEKCIEGTGITLNLKSLFNSEITINEIYIFYFWIEKKDSSDIQFNCNNIGPSITPPSSIPGLYQFYLKYSNNKFSFGSDSFDCSDMKLYIYNSNISLKKIKVTSLITNEILNCKESGKCPSSYYCDNNSGECKKCPGIFSECQNKNLGRCGRFTTDWEDDDFHNSCSPDYFNLQQIGEMSFDITPPIKSNAASLSFWFFTLSDINDSSNIIHISLEDFFVVTIIQENSEYIIYLTAYQMYHEVYEHDIQKITNKEDFLNIIKNYFPYKYWKIKKVITKKNRWINVIVTFNKNVPRIGMQIFYRKNYNEGNNINDKEASDNDFPSEYIYKNENNKSIQSKLHFKKFYRNSDIMHLNVNIYNNDIGVYIRKIYVYATELLITQASNSEKLLGFQYIEYEEILNPSNYLMPELILAVPFDKISKIDPERNLYSIQYYMYDMTKIYNNRLTKNLIISPGNIDESLYDYDPRLYRLNLLSKENKKYSNPYKLPEDHEGIIT